MDPKKSDECWPEIGFLSSVANKELGRVDEDPKERKRERERVRFASMSNERRNELNKKRRELYQRKKVDKNRVSSCGEVIDARLLRNKRDRARRALMSSNKREEINRKRRELYQRKKEQSMFFEPKNDGGQPTSNRENVDPSNYGQIPSADIIYMRREKKCTYSRQWYKNMPLEKREARKERERLCNATFERKEAKRAWYRRREEFRANTLHPDSIAMENPMYIPSP